MKPGHETHAFLFDCNFASISRNIVLCLVTAYTTVLYIDRVLGVDRHASVKVIPKVGQ